MVFYFVFSDRLVPVPVLPLARVCEVPVLPSHLRAGAGRGGRAEGAAHVLHCACAGRARPGRLLGGDTQDEEGHAGGTRQAKPIRKVSQLFIYFAAAIGAAVVVVEAAAAAAASAVVLCPRPRHARRINSCSTF